MPSIKTLFLETRPQYLLLSVLLVILGGSLAEYYGTFVWDRFWLCLIGLVLLHISTNVLNDYFDYASGIDLETLCTPFNGGSGLLRQGLLTPRQTLGFGLAASNGFVAPFANERQLGFVSWYYIAYSASAVLTRLLGARLADRLGEERILPYAMILTGLGLSCLVFLGGNGVLVVAGAMAGCGHGFLYPGLSALALRNEPSAIRGKITGAFTGSIDAGAFVGSIMLGFIGQWAGFQTLFLVAGAALLVAFMLYQGSRLTIR